MKLKETISIFHAILVVLISSTQISWKITEKDYFKLDNVTFYTILFSNLYFIFDSFLVKNKIYLIHHFVCIYVFTMSLLTNKAQYYILYILFYGEITNPLSYLYNYYYKLDKNSLNYKTTSILFGISFFICRVFILPYYSYFILGYMYKNSENYFELFGIFQLTFMLIVGFYWAILINYKSRIFYKELFKFLYLVKDSKIIQKRSYLDIQVISHLPIYLSIPILFYKKYTLLGFLSIITATFSLLYHIHREQRFILIENILAQVTIFTFYIFSNSIGNLFLFLLLFIFYFTNKNKQYYQQLHWLNHIIISLWGVFLPI